MDVGAVEAPQDSEESRNASGHDNRSRHREVSFPGSRHRRGRQCNRQAAIEAPSYPHVLSKAAVVPGWYRSLRIITPLVARDQSAWPHGPPDATCLCEALRDNPKLSKMGADRIDHRSLLANEQMTCPMERQTALLLRCLGLDEPHRRSPHCLADCLGVRRIVLLSLDVRLHIGRWHQADRVAKRFDLARPMV